MREIKFKVWEKEYKPSGFKGKMHVNINLGFVDYCLARPDEYEVMQFTGLYDKNNTKIYEGDIVCILEEAIIESYGGFSRTEPEGIFGKVTFEDGAYYVGCEPLFDCLEVIEIIGNIYQNSDLLND